MNEIKGNLLDFPNGIDAIIHGCNTLATMGSGVAAQIAKRYPKAEAVDRRYHLYCNGDPAAMLGMCSYARVVKPNGRPGLVINLYQQASIGLNRRLLNYEAFYRGLVKAHDRLPDTTHFGIPRLIGCYRAGGSWSIVKAMIKEVFDDRKLTIVEYKEPKVIENIDSDEELFDSLTKD